MNTDISILFWLNMWFQSNCNGDWEHNYGILIETIDNPGWAITIDLQDTETVLEDKEWTLLEESSTSWYGYKVANMKYEASCDPRSLEKIISIFRNMVEISSSKSLDDSN